MKRIEEVESSASDHEDSGSFIHAAEAHRQAGDYESALLVLREGLETHASFLPGYVLLGQILIEQHRLSEALVTFDRVLELEPGNKDALAALDVIAVRMSQDAPYIGTGSDRSPLVPHEIDELYTTPAYESGESAETPPVVPAPPASSETLTVALADLLVGLLEYRDPHFRGGSSLTRLLAAAIGRELGLSTEELNAIELGVVLRDLGQVPLRPLLSKRDSELTGSDRNRIARHIETTLNLLAGLELPPMALEVIRHHHERWDGTGYPKGLVGKATPVAARIAGVADSFAAMISARPHRLPRRPPAAFDEISRLSGKQYDPTIVNALERVLEGADWRGVRFGLRHHVLIVDGDETRGVALAVKLCSQGYLAEAVDLDTARERFEYSRLSGIIVSAGLGESAIRQLIGELRGSARLALLPIVVTDTDAGTRVSLLEAGADMCLASGSSFEELRATLGAFLRREDRAALNTRRHGEPPPWSGLQGALHDFPLHWLLQMLDYDGRTAAIWVNSNEGSEGVIYVQKGQPRHAQTGTAMGDDALREMLTWDEGTFRVGPEVQTEKDTVQLPLMKLLLDRAAHADYAAIFGTAKCE